MGDIWQLADIEELKFSATASLLAIRGQHKSLPTASQPELQYSDESEDEDVQEEWATTRPTAKLNKGSRNTLIDKFLDRFGEVFARKKSFVQQINRKDSKHIAAAAWINGDHKFPITILLAKNEGLDDRDSRMSTRLQSWFRAIAATGRLSPIRIDSIWIGNKTEDGLLEYSRSRLEYHVSQINQLGHAIETVAAQAGVVYGPVITCLQCLCKNFERGSTVYRLSDIVNVAYQLRSIWKKLPGASENAKALRAVTMLSRLRAAYECFKTTALSFPQFISIKIKPVTLPHYVEIDTTSFRKQLSDLRQQIGFSKGTLKNKAALRYTGASRLHVHAEIQILVTLESNLGWHRRAHRYIGTSRKPCFLCNEFIQNYIELSLDGVRSPSFASRESHGKLYPLWTLPVMQSWLPNTGLSMATAVIQVYRRILQLLHNEIKLQPAIAESSAAVTQTEAFLSGFTTLKRHHLAIQRASGTSRQIEECVSFGTKIKSVRVCVLPANGMAPELVHINFYGLPEKRDRRIPEFGHYFMPDFHDYWGESQLNRQFRRVSVSNQDVKALEGEYWIYWNENDELPENMHIKNLLGIKHIEPARRFWYGDVFIVRFSEQPTTFVYDVHDVPIEVLQWHGLKALLQDMWQEGFLESQLEEDRYFDERQEKIETDKDIIFQRMYVITV